jgi:diadenylate cyclase
MEELASLASEDLMDVKNVARILRIAPEVDLDASLEPRGFRLLSKIPRLPESVIDRIVAHFSTLQKTMRATVEDLDEVGGVGGARARAVKDGLSRLAETSILDRYS